jgi:DNA-directed RNA polymerase subunit L
MGSNPTKLLDKAATSLEEECDEFKEEFRRALEK